MEYAASAVPGRSWDAAAYQRVSVAMDRMAQEVLDRLPLRGDETVLDAGCGTGRISAKLLARWERPPGDTVDYVRLNITGRRG